MNKRMRRMTYREEQEAAARAKRGEAPATPTDGRTDGRPADSTDGDRPSGPGDDRSGPQDTPRPGA
jgi:hypothetical protein